MIETTRLGTPWRLRSVEQRGRNKTPTALLQDDINLIFAYVMGLTESQAEERGKAIVQLLNAAAKIETALDAIIRALESDGLEHGALAAQIENARPGTVAALRAAHAALGLAAKD